MYWKRSTKSLQSCLTLCDPTDGSPPGSPIPGILQARTLQWVAISFSNAWKWKVKVKLLSRVQLLVIPWTAAHQAPPSMGFYRQECWSGVSLPSLEWDCLGSNLSSAFISCEPLGKGFKLYVCWSSNVKTVLISWVLMRFKFVNSCQVFRKTISP